MSGDEAFVKWQNEVNLEIIKITSLGINDLPDVAYRDMYEDEMSPKEAAEFAIEEAGGGDLLDA